MNSVSSKQGKQSKFLQETIPEEVLSSTRNSRTSGSKSVHEALPEEDVSNIHLSQNNESSVASISESLSSSKQSNKSKGADESNKKQSTLSPLNKSIHKESLFDDSDSISLTQSTGKPLDTSPVVESGSSQKKSNESSQILSISGETLTNTNNSKKKDSLSNPIKEDELNKSLSLSLTLNDDDKEETETIMLNTHKLHQKSDPMALSDTKTLTETTGGTIKPLVKKEILSDEEEEDVKAPEKNNNVSVVQEEKIEDLGDSSASEEEDESALFSLNHSLHEQSFSKKETGELSSLVDPTIQSTLLKPVNKQQESFGLSFNESTEATEVQPKPNTKNVQKSATRLSSTRPSSEIKFSSLGTTESTISDYVPTKSVVSTPSSEKKIDLAEPSHISDDEEFMMTDNKPIPHVSSTSDSILHDEILSSSTFLGTKESSKIPQPAHINEEDVMPQKEQVKTNKQSGIRVSFHPDFIPHPKPESNLFSNASIDSSETRGSLSIPPSERLKRYNEEHSQLSELNETEKSKAIIDEYEEKSKGGSGNDFSKLTMEEDRILRIILPQAVNMETHEIYEAVAKEMGTQRTNPSVIKIVANICRYFDIPMERINPLEVTNTFNPLTIEEESDDDYF